MKRGVAGMAAEPAGGARRAQESRTGPTWTPRVEVFGQYLDVELASSNASSALPQQTESVQPSTKASDLEMVARGRFGNFWSRAKTSKTTKHRFLRSVGIF